MTRIAPRWATSPRMRSTTVPVMNKAVDCADFRQTGVDETAVSKALSADNLLIDLAKGLVDAQSQINSKTDAANDQKIVSVLEKISQQLDNITQLLSGNQAKSGKDAQAKDVSGTGQAQPGSENENSGMSQELKTLFSQLLTSKQGCPPSSQQTKGATAKKGSQAQPAKAAQTVPQALAQAQYELSQELDTSLQKLTQVISESENLANRISVLIGEENTGKGTGGSGNGGKGGKN